MPYPVEMVAPMRAELTDMGVRELTTAADVDDFFSDARGTALVLVNSVCGCAAGNARPGLKSALEHTLRPDRVATVFAGQDLEATERARERFGPIPPSSPSFALLKDGEVVDFLTRQTIESLTAEGVAGELTAAFEKHCRPSGRGCTGTGAAVDLEMAAPAAAEGPVDPETLVELTSSAGDEVRRLLSEEAGEDVGLRLAVTGGGCSGLLYDLQFDSRREDDVVVACDGFDVLIDPASASRFGGVTLDYERGLNGRGFQFRNPNARKTCSCGDSFAL